MDTEAVLKVIESRFRDEEQKARIAILLGRVEAAFRKNRSRGVKDELESDWNKPWSKFGTALEAVKKDTGLR